MNVLIITSSYPPEIRSSSHLMQELAEELSSREHTVVVATTYPTMNLADNDQVEQFQKYSKENNVNIIRIKTLMHPHNKGNFIQRGISQLLLPYFFLYGINKYFQKKIHAVIVYSPPLTLAIAGKKIAQKTGAKFVLNVQDIFPQNAIDLNILKNSILIKLFEFIEKDAYRNSNVITVHSENNRRHLIERKHIPSEKVTILHNWIDIGNRPQPVDGHYFRKKMNLDGKFIFFFGGVMGPSQGLDLIIRAAKKLEKQDEIIFLLAGDGLEKKRLEILAKRLSIKNVIFHPFISKADYHDLLREINVGMVCLNPKNKTPVVPGKLIGYMAASVPVVAFLNKESDGHQIIRASRCGFSIVSNDVEKAVGLLQKIYENREHISGYGKNGYDFALKHFSKKICIDKIEALIH